MNNSINKWLFALLLTIPMTVFYANHYLHYQPHLQPTGFIAYDNVSYVAYAKQYTDAENFSVFYSNPFNPSSHFPRIYFQSQNLFLLLLLSLGFAPGFALVFFNWLATFFSFRMVISLYDHLFPSPKNRKLFIAFFCWGGGLLAVAGMPVALVKDMPGLDFFDRMFFLDPAWGWWGLNFARGHFISSEGYYHFLFVTGIYCLLKKKWGFALLAASVLSVSHPFTGIEFLLIVVCWCGCEKFFAKNKDLPWWLVVALAALLCFHVFYYLFYLNQFADHRSVSNQYALNWRLRFFSMIPAYCIVGALALYHFVYGRKTFFTVAHNRLFLWWFVVAFVLVNHEIFMKPMQPLHFTRGYVWTSLFLLGLPALHQLFNAAKLYRRRLVLVFFSVFFFSDNFLWIVNSIRLPATTASTTYITHEQKNIFKLLEKNAGIATLIVSGDEVLPYMSTVYTKAYPWLSHPFTTPFAAQKSEAYNQFILTGATDSLWKNREVVFIFRKKIAEEVRRARALPSTTIFITDTENYIVCKTFFGN